MTSFTVSLLCMAGIIGLVRGQNGIVIVGETTASPTVTQMATSAPDLLLTAAEVIAQGGGNTCRWRSGIFSECSTTCVGTQTRDVDCSCTLRDGTVAQATEDNCDRDDPALKPTVQRQCGAECRTPRPPTTSAPTTSASTTSAPTTSAPTTSAPTTPPALACTWSFGQYSDCSATCEGTQTRGVSCQCEAVGGSGDGTDVVRPDVTTVADSVCEDDLSNPLKPIEERDCGGLCPSPSPSPSPSPPPVCTWNTTQYGDCSATCEGTQSRDVFCNCAAADGSLTRTTDDACTGMRPNANRSCGGSCPVQQIRECNVTECQDSSDCFDTECCLQVPVKDGKDYSNGSYCFPLVELNNYCDMEGNWACPCAAGLECSIDTMMRTKRSHKKNPKRILYVHLSKDECPHIHDYREKYRRYYTYGTCNATQGVEGATSETSTAQTATAKAATAQAATPVTASRTCNISSCQDQSDCMDEECCLEVEYEEYKVRKRLASFCIPLGDMDDVCDIEGNWTCPCKDTFNCTEDPNYRSKGKHGGKHEQKGKHSGKYKNYDYKHKVKLGRNEECPTLLEQKKGGKKHKYLPTCQEPSERKRRASSYNDETDDYNRRTVVVVVD